MNLKVKKLIKHRNFEKVAFIILLTFLGAATPPKLLPGELEPSIEVLQGKKRNDPETKPSPKKEKYSQKELCKVYEGKVISYFDQVFSIEKCQRKLLASEDDINKILKSKKKIVEVEPLVIAGIPEHPHNAKTQSGIPSNAQKQRSCKELEGKYIYSAMGDFYIVEKCKKRQFPNWESYVAHRSKKGRARDVVLSVSDHEFYSLEDGKIFSDTDEMDRKKMREQERMYETVDLIPIKKACQSVNGKFVSYYSKIYKVENCKKREISTDDLDLMQKISRHKIVEITSEQWLSIPDGKPLTKL